MMIGSRNGKQREQRTKFLGKTPPEEGQFLLANEKKKVLEQIRTGVLI
jgi:hypothetical protein